MKTRWSLRLEGHRWIWANWEAHAVDGNGEWLDIWSWHRGFVTLCLAAWRPRTELKHENAVLRYRLSEGLEALKDWENWHLSPDAKMRDGGMPEIRRLGQWMGSVAALLAAGMEEQT